MSGALRKAVGPKRNAMNQRYQKAKLLLDKRTPSDIATGEEFLCELNVTKSKLTDSISGMETLDDRWMQLIGALDEDALAGEEELYDKFAADPTEGYLNAVEVCCDTLPDVEGRIMMVTKHLSKMGANNTPSDTDASASSTGNRSVRAKLPKLVLPIFEGKDSLEWNPFWTIFAANVDAQEITKTEKFAYLLAQLRGTALETIKGLSISDTNYELAVGLLKQRFERGKGSMVRLLYSQLKQIPSCDKYIRAVRQTFNDSEAILRQLEEAGEDLNSNTSLAVDILRKYPILVIRELSQRYSVTDDSTITEIREAVQKYVKETERLNDSFSHLRSSATPSETKSKAGFHANNTFDSGTKSTSALSTVDSKETAVKPFKQDSVGRCYFCDGEHYNSECPTFPSANQRIFQLRKRSRCERCGRDQHSTKDCRRQIRCIHCRTTNNHYTALCKQKFPSPTPTCITTSKANSSTKMKRDDVSTAKPSSEESKPNPAKDTNVTILNVTEKSVLLTAKTMIVNGETGSKREARLIFDSASHRSYILSAVADELNLTSDEDEHLKVSIFGTKRTLTMNSRVVSCGIQQRDGSIKAIVAHTTLLITQCPVIPQGFLDEDQTLLSSMKYALADDLVDHDSTIDILIGSEYFWDFIIGSQISTNSGLRLIPSTVGLLLAGQYSSTNQATKTESTTMLCMGGKQQTVLTTVSAKNKLNSTDIDEFWELERIGIGDDPTVSDDDKALSHFNAPIYQRQGRYHVKWPWIEEKKALLPDNYELSLGRLRSLVKRLKTDKRAMLDKYQEVIDKQCTSGIIEKVPAKEVKAPRFSTHYLPHHPVVKPSSMTTKLRIVYDASSKARKHSVALNECIYRGPVMLPQLCEVLIRFRNYPYVIVADVEKAFLQLALQPSERDVTRFLWLEDSAKLEVEGNTAVYRFCRVPFGVLASPFLLGATIQHHMQKYFDTEDETAHKKGTKSTTLASCARNIAQDIYVDNITCGANTETEAIERQRDMTTLFNAASMNLQEFNSHSEALLRQVDEEALTKSRIVKLLGVIWDSKHDSLKLAKRDLSGSGMSKRSMLRTIASIFDPLGLFLPCTLRPKLIIQKLWDMDLDWDKPTPLPIRDEWNESIQQLDGLLEQTVPRFVGLCSPSTTSIVVFCDASAKAYATAVYIRIPSGQSHPTKWTSNLVFAKSRLTPKSKAITLPRLELLAMTIGARAGEFVRQALHSGNTTAIHLFTDARVALNWLETKRLLAKFVANRVQAIRSVPNSTLHHVSTEENPADYCTRGKSAAELFSSDKWWHGPSFLSLDVDQWPTRTYEPMSSEALLEMAAEVRPCELMHTCTFANVHRDPDRAGVTDTSSFCGINAENTSCLRTLLRITVIVIKFVKLFLWNKLSNATRQRYPVLQRVLDSLTNGNNYTSKDQKIAKNCWVASVQRSHFSEVIVALQSGRKNSLISQLGIREDENGLLRSYSRLDHADLPSDTKYPKLLPKSHLFTTIVIEDIHTRLLHSGVSHTLSEVRREFWIPQGRAAVRRVLQRCVPCRRSKGPPFPVPNMPPWPRERLECQAPFQSTGLDYLGPISVKVGDVVKKTWICLFTCLVVRAIHLEVVSDCTAKEFLDCLIRFVSRRGTPSLIISDNAPQFRTTKGVLDRVWHSTLTDPSILSYCADNGIEWRFTIELAPWQGGFYERLVQVVKRTMRTAIGRRLLSWTEFITHYRSRSGCEHATNNVCPER